MTHLESPVCPLCGNKSGKIVYEGGNFAPYGIMSCPSCNLRYLSPRLKEEDMLAHYAKDQYFSGQAHGYADYAAQEPALRATFRRLLQTLAKRGRTGGALLEIGCGYGYLLDEALDHFSRRVGTDFSPDAVRVAKGNADEVYQGGVEAVLGTEIFDCVIATHVIEHVYHPHEFIKTLLKRLRPVGRSTIAAPDMGSIWQKLMGAGAGHLSNCLSTCFILIAIRWSGCWKSAVSSILSQYRIPMRFLCH